MKTATIPANEEKRISALKRYNILDTPPDGTFDLLTQLASEIFEVPIAIVSLVDSDRIWFKSAHGLTVKQIDREPGLCASAILTDDLYVVNDARKDPRTLSNPLVAGEFGLQFYAAAPLHTQGHYNLGTFCLLDKKPRKLTEKEQRMLSLLGRIVMEEMEMRLSVRDNVLNIKKLISDVSYQLDKTSNELGNLNQSNERSKVLEYLDASRHYLKNAENQLKVS